MTKESEQQALWDEWRANQARVELEYADYIAYSKDKRTDYIFPHCDSLVLHHPFDECEYCNRYASHLQLFRYEHGIAFTGHEPTDGQRPCPATIIRPAASIYAWGGNMLMTAERRKALDAYWAAVRDQFDTRF